MPRLENIACRAGVYVPWTIAIVWHRLVSKMTREIKNTIFIANTNITTRLPSFKT